MTDNLPRVKAAVVQASPLYLDRDATVAKACRFIEEAGDNGAKIIAFPECYVPAYPDWLLFYPAAHPLCSRCNVDLFRNSVVVPSAATDQIGHAARRSGAYVVLGVNEKEANSYGTMYNTLLFFGPDGKLLGKRRKLVPTIVERLVHAGGDGSGLRVFPTPYGGLSGLICGESTNLLAKFALFAQGEAIHVASWPAPATKDKTGLESIDICVRAAAYEGKVFVLSSTGIFSEEMKDALALDKSARAMFFSDGGRSTIVNPSGQFIAGPIPGEGIIYAELDLEQTVVGKLVHDVVGHYNRFDIFSLSVDRRPRPPLRLIDGPETVGEPRMPTMTFREEDPR